MASSQLPRSLKTPATYNKPLLKDRESAEQGTHSGSFLSRFRSVFFGYTQATSQDAEEQHDSKNDQQANFKTFSSHLQSQLKLSAEGNEKPSSSAQPTFQETAVLHNAFSSEPKSAEYQSWSVNLNTTNQEKLRDDMFLTALNKNLNDQRTVELSSGERSRGQSSEQDDLKASGSEALKTPEQVADEEEDDLINVLPDSDSLLFEGRPSYSILRFCTANAILDQKILDGLGLPLGFMWTPFGRLPGVPRLTRDARRCDTCASFLAKGNGSSDILKDPSVWKCSFCGCDDNKGFEDGLAASLDDAEAYPELHVDTVEYVEPTTEKSIEGTKPGAIILIVDENLSTEEAEWAREAAAVVHATTVERGLFFALITVGSGCSVAVQRRRLEDTPSMIMMSPDRAAKLSIEEKEQFFLRSPQTSTGDVQNDELPVNDDSTVEDAQNRPASFTGDFITAPMPLFSEGDLAADVGHHSDNTEKSHRFPASVECRRLDAAIAIACELVQDMASGAESRVLSLITGPPSLPKTTGIGNDYDTNSNQKHDAGDQEAVAEKNELAVALERIGTRAGGMGIALDFLVLGAARGFSAPAVLGASKRSRGGVVYCAAHSFSAGAALANAAASLAEQSSRVGILSVRVSAPLMVSRVIGPALRATAAHTYTVPSADQNLGFAVILRPIGDKPAVAADPQRAVVQLASQTDGIMRVTTITIPLVSSPVSLLNSMDAELCALVLAKACVVSSSGITNPAVVAQAIDSTIRRLLLGSEATDGIARMLYELRRGALVEQRIHPDQSLMLRSLFLRAECTLSSLLMSPRLFTNMRSDTDTDLMGEVPLEKPFITNDAIVVLDAGANMFVYVGNIASYEDELAICESARKVAAQRPFPCQLWKLKPGRDANYVLDTYLSSGEIPGGKMRSRNPVDDGFGFYCQSIAPESSLVRSFQKMSSTQ